MDPDRQRLVSKVWEGVWAGEGSANPRSDSGLNSMEYWDYSVELECITGQQGDNLIITQSESRQYLHSDQQSSQQTDLVTAVE